MPVAVNGECSLYYESFGDPVDPTLLMVNGLGAQCVNFHVEWCNMFVDAGFRVIRFDNRDIGLSTHFNDAPVDPEDPAYVLTDMAADAVAVLDAAGVERAHALGLSMGGMIVQHLAIYHRDRLLSVISAMSRTGEADYGQSTVAAKAHLTGPQATDRQSFVERHIVGQRIWGSPAHPEDDRWRTDAERAYERSFDPAGFIRQYNAANGSPPWAHELSKVKTPTLVLHGSADTLIDISGGRRTAELIPGARFVEIGGMGHDYPRALWARWVEEVSTFCLGDLRST